MKCKVVMILIVMAFSIAVPPTLSLTVAHDKQAAFGVLDVCHSAAPALFSNGDMPCVNAFFCHPLSLEAYTVSDTIAPSLKTFLIALQDERPPKN